MSPSALTFGAKRDTNNCPYIDMFAYTNSTVWKVW